MKADRYNYLTGEKYNNWIIHTENYGDFEEIGEDIFSAIELWAINFNNIFFKIKMRMGKFEKIYVRKEGDDKGFLFKLTFIDGYPKAVAKQKWASWGIEDE
jgi:hypothetical protein